MKTGDGFLVSTVRENRENFTKRQFDAATAARAFYHTVGCPTLENLKFILQQNTFKNCPVTPADVDIAERIFGPDLGSLKGKSTQQPPVPVRDDLIEIPAKLKAEHKDLVLCMDVMYVNGLPLLTAIDRSIRYRSAVAVEDRSNGAYYKAIDDILRTYGSAGFRITQIYCDQEFKHMMDAVKDDLDVTMVYTATGNHVSEAERNNRTLKERIRATYHHLPYKTMPRLMLVHLAITCCQQLNVFQPRMVSQVISALMLYLRASLWIMSDSRFPLDLLSRRATTQIHTTPMLQGLSIAFTCARWALAPDIYS